MGSYSVAILSFVRAFVPLVAVAVAVLVPDEARSQSYVATYSTFVGSRYDASTDEVLAVSTDDDGNIYVAGMTRYELNRPDEFGFPTTPSSLQLPNTRNPDDPCETKCGYILKLSPDHEVVYGVILPMIEMQAIAVGADGAVYAAGTHYFPNGDAPITPGAFSRDGNVILIKLRPDGTALDYGQCFARPTRVR
jgi:hypothetical protein